MDYLQLASKSLADALAETLGSEGTEATHGQSPLCIAAIVGFTGEHARGTLGVTADGAGLERVLQHFGLDPESDNADESIGELGNLLLGHVKRCYGRHGLDIALSTPMVVRGLSIQVEGRQDSLWVERAIDDGTAHLVCWLDTQSEPEVEIPDEVVNSDIADQGDALFF
ncbi:MAG: chemotaxis protein CheX [Planctomycetota bacterium]